MVLEACERPTAPRHELAVEQHVPDHPLLAGDGLVREETDAGHRVAVAAEVTTAEQLVAAADREQRRAVRNGRLDRVSLRDEIGRDQRLFAVLAAADVVEVVLAGRELRRPPRAPSLELVPAERCPPPKDGDVAAVGVDVQVLRVQVSDADLHERSQ